MSCYSGRELVNFVDTFTEKGANYVFGFSDRIEDKTSEYWANKFVNYLTMGYTIGNAIQGANADLEDYYENTIYESQIPLITEHLVKGNGNTGIVLFS